MNNLDNRAHGKGGRRVFSEPEELEIYRLVVEEHKPKTWVASKKGVHRNTIKNICQRLQGEADRAACLESNDDADGSN